MMSVHASLAIKSMSPGSWVFEDPAWFLLLLLIPLAAWTRHRRGGAAILFAPGIPADAASPSGLAKPRVPTSVRARFRVAPAIFHVVGLVLVVVALARPQDRSPLPQEAEGIDILLCVDTSSSMRETDMDDERDRLAVAKHAALRFVAARPFDRIGLVSFARYTDLLCPPTRDHEALATFLNDLDLVERNSKEDMTGIGAAIALSARALRDSAATSRVVVLLTDGEENVASDDKPEEIGPLPAAQFCEAFGIRVYTVAVGKERRDGKGTVLPLDTEQVREVARRTGGEFLEAKDASGLDRVYERIDRLEKVFFRDPGFEVEDRFRAVLLAAAGFLLAGYLMRLLGLEASP